MLKTDYKDDVFTGQRKYTMTDNGDNTYSFTDATVYSQVGDNFGADDINATNEAVNGLNSYLELTQTLSTTNPTDFVFTDVSIHSNSSIQVLAGRANGDVQYSINYFYYSDIYTTEGQCTVTFPAFEESDTSLKVRIHVK